CRPCHTYCCWGGHILAQLRGRIPHPTSKSLFILRGASLIWLPFILTQPVGWELIVFAVVFGIFDVATVPPVINLCNQIFGDQGPSAFSWINVAHQLGAGLVALTGGMIAFITGSYFILWFIAGGLCFIAAVIVLSPYHGEKPAESVNV
ncbi:MFS transporter, partial [Vreelandella subterranea]|uniref:MFS transporter n=1 Tax=Vreelandella subterranea TaxID=416874 RepID=UPI0030EF48CD